MKMREGGAVLIVLLVLIHWAEMRECNRLGLQFKWGINCVEHAHQQGTAIQPDTSDDEAQDLVTYRLR